MIEKVILPEDVILKKVTMDLWETEDGKLFEDEGKARQDTATHCRCLKGHVHARMSRCPTCHYERFLALPEGEWDHDCPLFEYDGDEVFWDESDIEQEFDEDDDLAVIHCYVGVKTHLPLIPYSRWDDLIGPDESLNKYCPELLEKLQALNDHIEKNSEHWIPGPSRITFRREDF